MTRNANHHITDVVLTAILISCSFIYFGVYFQCCYSYCYKQLSLEVLHHLNLLCRGESAVCGGQASCVGHLQGTEAALLQVALSRIQATASTHQHTLTCDAASASSPFKCKFNAVTLLEVSLLCCMVGIC